MRLRTPLQWGLVATVLATAGSLVWPTHAVVDVQNGNDGAVREAAPHQTPHFIAVRPGPGANAGGIANLQPLQEAGAKPAPPVFDPFVGIVLAPVVAAAPQPGLVAAPPPPPPPPPQEYRYLGRVTGPDGIEQVLLVRGESVVPVARGTALDNGYVVESVSQDAVVLTFPSLGTRSDIPIPSTSTPPR